MCYNTLKEKHGEYIDSSLESQVEFEDFCGIFEGKVNLKKAIFLRVHPGV
jgi:hypothetical protein